MTKDSQQVDGQAAVLHRTSTSAMPQFPSGTPDARAQSAARSLPGKSRFLDQVRDACRVKHLAYRLLEDGTDIRTVQDLPGHASVETTMIYTHVMAKPGLGVRSPLDG